MASLGSEFTKGLGRGLGYSTARNILGIAEGISNVQKETEIKRFSENGIENLRESTSVSNWFLLCTIFLWPLAFFFVPIYSLIRYHKKTVTVKSLETDVRRIPDRRYNSGYRIETISYIKKIKVEATPEEMAIFRKQGKGLLLASVVVWGFFITYAICLI